MRLPVATGLFALAVLAAACGGGGGSTGVVPGGPNIGTTPGSAMTARANIVFLVPPASKQSSARRPFYISSSTQSFGILAVAAASTETPAPGVNMQIFPVTTPSPCSVAVGGGETCTFSVVAPVGNDIFYIGAFASPNPGINSVPLSEFQASVTVSLNPSPGATPLTFALNGVVNEVVVTVPIPDPHNTPNTAVFTEGVVSNATKLGITAYDAANNIVAQDPTIVFATPIPITVTPGTSGIGVSIVGSQCGSGGAAARPRRNVTTFSNGAASVSITCAADLNNVYFGYDGTVHVDSSDHILASESINAGAEHAMPTPSPANVALASNLLTYQLSPNSNTYSNGLVALAGGQQLLYTLEDDESQAYLGTFTIATHAVSAPSQLIASGQDYVEPSDFAATAGGQVWVVDEYNYPSALDCFNTTSGGTSATPVHFTAHAGADSLYIDHVAVDGSGNVWYLGNDDTTQETWVGHFAPGSSCTTPGVTDAQFLLNGDVNDLTAGRLTPLSNGIAYASDGNADIGLYIVTTSSGSSVNGIATASSGSPVGAGVAVDNTNVVYAVFNQYIGEEDAEVGAPAVEKSNGTTLSHYLSLPPSSGNPGYGEAYGLAAFSPSGAADRFAYDDEIYTALGVIENVQATPIPLLISLPNAFYTSSQAVYDSTGGEYIAYEDQNNIPWIAHPLLTPTWSAPVTVFGIGCSGQQLYSILERGDSGPFSVLFTPTNGSGTLTNTPFPDLDHDVPFYFYGSGTYNVTITDKNGRTQTSAITQTSSDGCGG